VVLLAFGIIARDAWDIESSRDSRIFEISPVRTVPRSVRFSFAILIITKEHKRYLDVIYIYLIIF